MRFKYLAKKGPKEKVQDTVEAGSHQEAVSLIINQGLFPIRVERVELREPSLSLPKRISQSQLLEFTRQLYNLLKAHVEFLEALFIIKGEIDLPSLKSLIDDIYQRVKKGMDFSKVLEDFPNIFPPFYVSLVRAGEMSGRLDFSLERICNYLEQQEDMKRKVISSLAYPIMMVLVGIGTIVVLFSFVIPRLSILFGDLGQNLPLITRILFYISSGFSRPLFWWFLVGILIFFFAYLRFTHHKLSFKKFLKMVPFLKNILLLESAINFSYTLSLMLKSGVSLLTALNISGMTLQDEKLNQQVKILRKDVIEGASLAESTNHLNLFPKILVRMMKIGEASGSLGEAMDATTQVLSKGLEARLKVVSSLIEPIIIFAIGLFLGLIVIALLLPILQISSLSM